MTTIQYEEVLKKYHQDNNFVLSVYQKSFPYSKKDFAINIITDKDMALLDELYYNNSSYSFKISYSFKDKFIKATAYYSTSIIKILPDFDIGKNCGCLKVDVIVNLPIQEAYKRDLSFENNDVNNFFNNFQDFLSHGA
jgi:hypothetical protein